MKSASLHQLSLAYFIAFFMVWSPQAQASIKPCTLLFEHTCLLEQLTPLINTQNIQKPNIKTSLARIVIELNHVKRNQAKIWPYHYKATKKEAIQNALLSSPAHSIWVELYEKSQKLSKRPKQKLSPKKCFNTMKPSSDPYLSSLFCTNLAITQDPSTLLQLPYTKALPEQLYLALIVNIHRNQIALAEIEAASRTTEHIIITTATQPKDIQKKTRNNLIENYLSHGFNELGLEALNAFTPHIPDVLKELKKRSFYRRWAAFIQYARLTHSKEMQSLLISDMHTQALNILVSMPLREQLKYHRLIAQGFFQSFFNSSAAHDLILAYHLQQWSYKWTMASQATQLEEGLEMLFLEVKIGSLLDHQKLLLIRRHQ